MKQLIIILFFPVFIFAQKTAIIKGKITDRNNNPIENVAITYSDKGTTSDKNGNYKLSIPIHKTTVVTFSHISFEKKTKKFTARGTRTFNYFPKLVALDKNLKEVVVKNRKKEAQGMLKIDSKKMNDLVGANAGVENILMTLPGVNNNNELSTQYNVRGGNFDENLVYVNGIEVYRPFLIRSGQQEGLSFINSQMIQNINFSAGGFQARYGDRLSSVLDITYRKPQSFKAQIDLSLLGANVSVEDSYLNNKLSAIVGVRYRDNSLFVNNKQTEVNFRPQFTDFQTYLSYKYSNKLTLNFLSNFSLNKYNYKPLTRKTRFGGFVNPIELIVFYQGQEKDEFKTLFGAFSTDYKINENLKLTGTISSFNTQEEEYFDIAVAYNLGEINTNAGSENFGEVDFSQGIGSQINHARNDLDALINAIQIRASLKKGKNEWQAGIKYQNENIRDKINEWEIIDSVGFSVRPPNSLINNQPYEPYSGPIEPYQNVKAKNTIDTKRITGFVQLSRKTFIENHELWMNFGARVHHWNIKANALNQKSNTVISPRIQLAIKPNWSADMLFRLSGGWYSQPPFYKEFRGYDGLVNPEVKAQKSIHIVTGNDYSFKLWNRPFKLTTEMYYKNLTEINAYSIDNVRIRYRADNLTDAYAYGIDMRLNGEFVPGNESWVSFGYLKTEENINDRGYIARPTDQRIKFGVLFQDYIPNLPSLKAYLNIVYNTGLPGGAPAYSDVYKFQNKLNDYKRADLGISYVLTDINKPILNGFPSKFKELTIGLELFNIFDIRNAITNTWVRDAYSKQQYGIPNYMTGRVLNMKLGMKF